MSDEDLSVEFLAVPGKPLEVRMEAVKAPVPEQPVSHRMARRCVWCGHKDFSHDSRIVRCDFPGCTCTAPETVESLLAGKDVLEQTIGRLRPMQEGGETYRSNLRLYGIDFAAGMAKAASLALPLTEKTTEETE